MDCKKINTDYKSALTVDLQKDIDEFYPPDFRIKKTIEFVPRTDDFRDEDKAIEELKPIAEMLKNTPNIKILVLGNVQVVGRSGNVTLNGETVEPPVLMNARGSRVVRALIELGVNADQLLFGPGRNLNDADSDPFIDFDIR